jgi:hypothetical protein
MATAFTLSRGPELEPGIDKGVHIIFYPPEGPGPMPTNDEFAVIERTLALAEKESGPILETDVIVIRELPYHRVNGKLKKHPEVHHEHPHTVLDLKVELERGVWWSEERFTIKEIKPHGPHHPAIAPQKPFPEPHTETRPDVTGREIHVARSATAAKEAKKAEYKLTFKRNGRLIDPNMRCS